MNSIQPSQFLIKLTKLCDGNAVFALAVYAQAVLFDKFVLFQGILDGLTQNAGALAMDDPHSAQVCPHGAVQIIIQHTDGLHRVHTPQIHLVGHGGQFHLPAGMGRASTLGLIGIFIFQQIDFLFLGIELQNACLQLIGAVLIDGDDGSKTLTFARGNGTLLDVDATFECVREASDKERLLLGDALVKAFKDYDLGWSNHFTDSTYDDIRDWLCWEFDVDLDNMDNNNPLGVTIYEITNYIWDTLCKETGNYQACTDYVEPEMVNKAEFIAKLRKWLELETDWNMEYDEEGRNDNYGKIDELVKYLEE